MNLKWDQRPIRRLILAVLVVGAAVAAGLVWQHQASPRHFLEVTPGVLYRSATLRPANLEKVITRYGIRTVVNLRPADPQAPPEWYRAEAAVCRKLGVELVTLPLDDYQVPSTELAARWIALLRQKDRLPVLVHCKYGVVRTGFMVAIYEIEFFGKDPHQAVADMPAFGHDLSKPELKPIRDMVLGFEPRTGVKAPPVN